MKVAIVTPYSWTVPGGCNAHVSSLARELRARGHEVRVLAPADGEVPPGVIALGRTIAVPFNGSIARLTFGPRLAARVRVALRRARPDVVHVHEPFAPGASLVATLSARAPVVATFHSANASRIYRVAGIPLRPLWHKIAVKIAVSPAARDTVARVFGQGARIVPNGVDRARFASVPPPDPASRTVLYFGRLEPRKGPQILVEAMGALVERVPGARVLLAGDGPLRAALERAVPDGLRGSVGFLGRFEADALPGLLASCAVACLPAIGGESFGITVVEAMAAGRAVVASSIPGYASVLDGTGAGVLVPPGDASALAGALASALGDPDGARAMGEAGRRASGRYDWPIVAAQVEEAYREAVATPRARRRRAG